MEWDRQVNEIFARALEIQSADEREAFLSQSCDQDTALRASVEELLRSHGKVGSFLENPAVGANRTIDVDPRALEAGFAATFVSDAAVVIGGARHSVLKSIGKTITRVPRVTLRDEDAGEQPRPVEAETDGRYQLEGEIARGGMGAILKGRDADLGRDLAIKVLLDSHRDNPDVVARFVEEAQIGGQLQHPGIVPVHELGQLSDQRPFFSMKLVKGETLASLLAKRQDANEDLPKFLGIFEQICQTMAYAHSRGVIHRDLKPANIMVGAFGEVQVMDWGLAKVLGETSVADTLRSEKGDQPQGGSDTVQTRRSRDSDAPDASQTRMGSVMGTPAYMPPEQALGEVHRLDERADVFGLGAILCEILTGDPPYVGEDGTEVYRQATQAQLDDCFSRLDACDAEPELLALAKYSLTAELTERLRDAGQLAERVSKYLNGVQERLKEAELASAKAQARRKLYALIACLLLVAAIGSAIAAGQFRRLAASEALARENAEVAREMAGEEARRANALRLATKSEKERQQFPVVSALLALESAEVTLRHDGTVLRPALESILNATVGLHGRLLECQGKRVAQVAVSPDRRWLVTAVDGPLAFVWDLQSGDRPTVSRVLRDHLQHRFHAIDFIRFVDHDRLITRSSGTGSAILWDLSKDDSAVSVHLFNGQPGGSRKRAWIDISPNRRWLAIRHDEDALGLWDLTADDLTRPSIELARAEQGVAAFAFSGDSRTLAISWRQSGSNETDKVRLISLWDLRGSEPARSPRRLTLPAEMSSPDRLAFAPQSRWLVAGGQDDGSVRLWDLHSVDAAAFPIQLTGEQDQINNLAISPDGKWVAAASQKVEMWLLGESSHATAPIMLSGPRAYVNDLEFSPDGRWLAVSSNDNNARLWDLHARDVGKSVSVLPAHENFVMDAAFDPESTYLVTGSWDTTARIWDLTENNPVSDRIVRVPGGQFINYVLFGPHMRRLIAATSEDEKIRVWSFDSGAAVGPPLVLDGFRSGGEHGVRISPEGRWLAAASGTDVRLWDLRSARLGTSLRELVGHGGDVRFFTFSRDERWMVTAGSDGNVQVWDLDATDPSAIVLDHGGDIAKGMEISPNGRWLATLAIGSENAQVRLWDFQAVSTRSSSEPTHRIALQGEGVNYCTFSPDNRTLVASTAYGTVVVLDVSSDDIASTVRHLGEEQLPTGQVFITPDSKTAITFGRVGKVGLWDLTGSGTYYELKGHGRRGTVMAADTQVRRLVTGSEDGTARVWDLRDPTTRPLVLREHDGSVDCVDISPDGSWVVTASQDKLRIWDLDAERALPRARDVAGRQLTPAECEQHLLPSVLGEQ